MIDPSPTPRSGGDVGHPFDNPSRRSVEVRTALLLGIAVIAGVAIARMAGAGLIVRRGIGLFSGRLQGVGDWLNSHFMPLMIAATLFALSFAAVMAYRYYCFRWIKSSLAPETESEKQKQPPPAAAAAPQADEPPFPQSPVPA